MSKIDRLVVLDVAHGNSAVIQEGETTVIVDTAKGGALLSFLEAEGIDTVDLVILSHSDEDHIGGMIGLLVSDIQVKAIMVNTDGLKQSETWRDLVSELSQAHYAGKVRLEYGIVDGTINIPGFVDTKLDAVAPSRRLALFGVGNKTPEGEKITSNTLSAVIRVSYNGAPVALLAGDMDQVTLNEIVRTGIQINAPLLVFPHHGGLPGNHDPASFVSQLLSAVQPKSVLFSMGRAKFSNPHPSIIAAVKSATPKVHIACTQLSKGCSKIGTDKESSFKTGIFSRGSATFSCCAGTMEVVLKNAQFARPNMVEHSAFITQFVPSPQCR